MKTDIETYKGVGIDNRHLIMIITSLYNGRDLINRIILVIDIPNATTIDNIDDVWAYDWEYTNTVEWSD